MPRTLTAVCASALLFTAAVPAMAQELRSEVVYFGDLDLYSETGADAMIRRIENAADRVCGDSRGLDPVAVEASARRCEVETTEFAISDLGHPMVYARYYDVNPQVVIEEGSADPYYADPYYTVRKK